MRIKLSGMPHGCCLRFSPDEVSFERRLSAPLEPAGARQRLRKAERKHAPIRQSVALELSPRVGALSLAGLLEWSVRPDHHDFALLGTVGEITYLKSPSLAPR